MRRTKSPLTLTRWRGLLSLLSTKIPISVTQINKHPFGFCSEVSDLTARLQREEDKHLAAAETLLQRVQKLTTENEELGASNATLEVDVSRRFRLTTPSKCGYNEDTKVLRCLALLILAGLSCPGAFLTALSLQASVGKLEQQLTDCESVLLEETVVSRERKLQAERAQYQVACIYSFITRTPAFRNKWPNVLIRE